MQGSTFQPGLDLEAFGELENNDGCVWASPPISSSESLGASGNPLPCGVQSPPGGSWKPPLEAPFVNILFRNAFSASISRANSFYVAYNKHLDRCRV